MRDIEESLQIFGSKYLENVYDERECSHALTHPYTAARYLAGRFAAREAILKLLNTHDALAMWNDVVLNDVYRSTIVQLRGEAQRTATARGITEIQLCIASNRELATAVAMGEIVSQ